MEATDFRYGGSRSTGVGTRTHSNQGFRAGRMGGFSSGEGGGSRLAAALGWFSIGLGLAELAAPRSVGKLIGLGGDDDTRDILIAAGLREIVSGIGILTNPRSAGWLQTRVGGDAMDLAVLGSALASRHTDRPRIIGAIAAVAGVTALDVIGAQRLTRKAGSTAIPRISVPGGRVSETIQSLRPSATKVRGIYVKKTITVSKPVSEVYAFWRDFENLPTFMRHLEEVHTAGGTRSHWKAKAPAGTSVEWYAEIVDDRPNELISWRSAEGSDIPNSGIVSFKPAPRDQGTEVTVELRYDPPGGQIGRIIAKLFGEEPGQQVRDDLFAFKQVMEIGEVVRSDGSPGVPSLKQRPAQPRKDSAAS